MSSSIGPTGPAGPISPTTITPIMTHIASLDELLSSHTALVAKETEDTALLQQLISVNRDSLRTNLFSWASNGFPNIYVVLSISLTLSSICSDGVNRNCYDYIEWLTSMTIPDMVANFQSRLTDIEASYSIVGSTIRLHVSRAK
jgi:hypothetical protein